MNKTLFQCELRVHFTAEHPKVDEFGFGIFQVWLFGENQQVALETAVKIVRLLPYKIFGAKSFPYLKDHALKHDPMAVICAAKAGESGFSFALHHWPKGTDENAVLGHWPLLVPPLKPNDQ